MLTSQKKKKTLEKKRFNCPYFIDVITVYIKISKVSTKKNHKKQNLLDLISEFGIAAGYKMNTKIITILTHMNYILTINIWKPKLKTQDHL